MTDRRRRTPWFDRQHRPPVHVGEYECAVRITSGQRTLILWNLEWDGLGFRLPLPMVVVKWRGLVKKPAAAKELS